MGFSVSASTAIVFAGLFLAFGILYPAVSNGFDQIQDAQVERDQAQLDLRNTAINITEANGGSITVENTGTTSLTVSEVDLLIDGEYQERDTDFTAEVVGNDGTDLWLPGDELEIESEDIDSNNRVKIVTEHGISAATEIQ